MYNVTNYENAIIPENGVCTCTAGTSTIRNPTHLSSSTPATGRAWPSAAAFSAMVPAKF
jgi:hypothetical protein